MNLLAATFIIAKFKESSGKGFSRTTKTGRISLCGCPAAFIEIAEIKVEGLFGELSSFHDTFGYYAQGVDQTTANLPEGWQERLIKVCNDNTNNISGLCLEIHDLAISKLYAGREKDIDFFQSAVKPGLLSKEILLQRLSNTQMSEEKKSIVKKQIKRGGL